MRVRQRPDRVVDFNNEPEYRDIFEDTNSLGLARLLGRLCQDLIHPMYSTSVSIVLTCLLFTPLGPDHLGNALISHYATWWSTVLCRSSLSEVREGQPIEMRNNELSSGRDYALSAFLDSRIQLTMSCTGTPPCKRAVPQHRSILQTHTSGTHSSDNLGRNSRMSYPPMSK